MKTSTPYLLLLTLFVEFMIACSHGNVGTKSVQTASQSLPANESSSSSDKIYTVVEQQPEFPGGTTRLVAYMRQNLRYPEAARRAKVEGSVFVYFTITKEGNVKDVQILKGLGFGTDEEAVHLVQTMPRWKPGKHLGEPVAVKYNIVVRFGLNGPY